jgi:acyl-[acyl-carrier-protein]-phospholipid O-acyltransferase/long-chain-fatty-acid--[acyl-carrier-protein] ligase
MVPSGPVDFSARLTLTALGFAAGIFVVPLQVILQARPPKEQKGRMIGAMNLINWIGIVLAAVFYQAADAVVSSFGGSPQIHWVFAALALIMLPVALVYHPRLDGVHLERQADSPT